MGWDERNDEYLIEFTESQLAEHDNQIRADAIAEREEYWNIQNNLAYEQGRNDAIDDVLFILYDKGYINSDDEEYIKEQLKEQTK